MDSKLAVRRHYDLLVPWYRFFWGDHIHHGLFLSGTENPKDAQLAMLKYCVSLLEPFEGTEALDIGCGHGTACAFLAQRLGCSTIGLTISPKQAARAETYIVRAGVQAKVEIVVADAECFPLENGRFDLVWLMESSEHFRDKELLMRRAAAALRKGGKLLLAAWTGTMQNEIVRRIAHGFLCPGLQTAHQYVEQLGMAGMQVVVQIDLSAYVWRTWEICKGRTTALRLLSPLVPTELRDFLRSFEVILQAYKSGDLRYSVLVAQK